MTEPSQYERFTITRLSDGAVVCQGSWQDISQRIPDNKLVTAKLKIIADAAKATRDLNTAREQLRADEAKLDTANADLDHALQEMGRRIIELGAQVAKLEPILQQFSAAKAANDAPNAEPFPAGPSSEEPNALTQEPEPQLDLEDDSIPDEPADLRSGPSATGQAKTNGEYLPRAPVAAGFDDE